MRDFAQPRRSAAIAANAMAATSHPLATLTAVEVLRAGGNAVDAALATVAVLGVVEPHMTGIGGDCFVLYSKAGALPIALNGSGRAPMKATVEWYRANGMRTIEVADAACGERAGSGRCLVPPACRSCDQGPRRIDGACGEARRRTAMR